MDALPAVTGVDIGDWIASGLVLGRPSSLVDEFNLQVAEAAFHGSVVVAAGGAAHRRDRLRVGELLAIGLGGMPASAVTRPS